MSTTKTTKTESFAGHTAERIEEMRRTLEAETGLNLSDLSPRGVVINYVTRHGEVTR